MTTLQYYTMHIYIYLCQQRAAGTAPRMDEDEAMAEATRRAYKLLKYVPDPGVPNTGPR